MRSEVWSKGCREALLRVKDILVSKLIFLAFVCFRHACNCLNSRLWLGCFVKELQSMIEKARSQEQARLQLSQAGIASLKAFEHT